MPNLLDDDAFWAIMNSPAYQSRWRGRAHPLLPQNGGVDFYNIEFLSKRLEQAVHAKATQPKHGLSGYSRQHQPEIYRDWILQVRWIEDFHRSC